MSKLDKILNMKPRTAMMMGSCAVALFATSLYVPNMRFEEMVDAPAPQAVTAEETRLQFRRKEQRQTKSPP